MSTETAHFHALALKRAQARTHRPCRTHRRPREVCVTCIRMFCRTCGHTCAPNAFTRTTTPPLKPKRSAPKAKRVLTPIPKGWPTIPNLSHIESSPDVPNAYRLHFPPTTTPLDQLEQSFWTSYTQHFTPTAFGASKSSKGWYVTVIKS